MRKKFSPGAPYVIVVDDDPVVGRSFDRGLSDKGYAVITAHDGPEALKKLAEVNFDVVFTDIRMPGMEAVQNALSDRRYNRSQRK